MNDLELWLNRLGGLAGLTTLAAAVWHMLRSVGRPAGREVGVGAHLLRAPILAAGTVLFVAGMIRLWRPLPLALSRTLHIAALALGVLLYFPSLALYLWGLRTLGAMFAPSTGFGVRLQVGHRLVTAGPYAHVRHPMYLAVITAGLGGLLLYRTWAMLLFAIMMFGLSVRARREEAILAAEFGAEWQDYRRRVPTWLPRPTSFAIRIRKTYV